MIIRGSKFLLRIKRNKYGNKKTVVDGNTFDSKLEAAVYKHLKSLERGGAIKDIIRQHTIYLTRAKISWRADFKAYDLRTGTDVLVEAKGVSGGRYRVILDLYRIYGPCPLWIFNGHHRNPKQLKTIFPLDWKVSKNAIR